MHQTNYDKIEANSTGDTIRRITRDVCKLKKSPDCSKLLKVEVPSLRLCYYCKNKTAVAKWVKAIKEEHPDREILISGK
jgi:hypothetical protein